MALTVEEWNELIKPALDSSDDSATVLSVLNKARDEYVGTFAELASAHSELEEARTENERLKQTNMELFLRVGKSLEVENKSPENPDYQEQRADTITIEDLFRKDEK